MTGALAPALQTFILDSYGQEVWHDVLHASGTGFATFELMLSYDERVSCSLLSAAAERLDRTPPEVLEDLGIYLVANEHTEAIRRLLRFGGADFESFLDTLGDLPDRARLALPHVILPQTSVEEVEPGEWIVWCDRKPDGLAHLMLGAIRAMADDYGALVLATLDDNPLEPRRRIDVFISSSRHAKGRAFDIGSRIAP